MIAELGGNLSTSAMIKRSAICKSSRDARPWPRRAARLHISVEIAVTPCVSTVTLGLDLIAVFALAVATARRVPVMIPLPVLCQAHPYQRAAVIGAIAKGVLS